MQNQVSQAIERFGWVYDFEGLDVLPEGRSAGRWGFYAKLNPEFALEVLNLGEDLEGIEEIKSKARQTLVGLGYSPNNPSVKDPCNFVKSDGKLTLLVSSMFVPGSAPSISLVGFNYKPAREVIEGLSKDETLFYSAFNNVDTLGQRTALLSCWLTWVSTVEKKIKY
ncbi:hypothetical protein HYT24_00525 [Candidatus Pacearchaeota archaeon]|nr:hypothetical protein [Candidatus Pacearchaeota archaeon]